MRKRHILLRIKYPKMILLIISFVLAYFIFTNQDKLPFSDSLLNSGLAGIFVVGMFFTFGFTSPLAAVLFLAMAKSQPIFLAAFVGGAGALIGDLFIFSFFRYSLKDEIVMLENERIVKKRIKDIPLSFRHYLLPVIAGLIIASPLPDEIGVLMFASFKKIHPAIFSILSFLLNTIGIFILLNIGQTI